MESEDEELVYLDGEDLGDQMELSEDQQEMIENQSIADVPYKRKQDSLYTLFNKVWRTPDSSKIGNLNNSELGKLNISVRDCQHIAMLSNFLHHPRFGSYFKGYGEVTLATSMAKKGWFVELFVSQKKFTARQSAVQSANPQKKSWLFGKKKEDENPQ